MLEIYLKDHNNPINVDFPAIHQFRQKKLLELIQRNTFEKIIDNETVKFAYDTYTDRVGLKKLPYCPSNFEVITPAYLNSYTKQ